MLERAVTKIYKIDESSVNSISDRDDEFEIIENHNTRGIYCSNLAIVSASLNILSDIEAGDQV